MMRRIVRGAATAAALTALVATMSVALTASPASAHTKLSPSPSCPGGELTHYHRFSNQVSIFVFFSSASGGTNCVWAQKQTNRGTPETMNVVLYRCATGNPGAACNPTALDQDFGQWEFYAGPVQLTNTSGRCIMIDVFYRTSWATPIGPAHCG
jgi:hypothetical protein